MRGPVKRVRCDRGTNFIGASNELKEEMEKIQEENICQFMLRNDADIQFIFNPPSASHFGGMFESQIGAV